MYLLNLCFPLLQYAFGLSKSTIQVNMNVKVMNIFIVIRVIVGSPVNVSLFTPCRGKKNLQQNQILKGKKTYKLVEKICVFSFWNKLQSKKQEFHIPQRISV